MRARCINLPTATLWLQWHLALGANFRPLYQNGTAMFPVPFRVPRLWHFFRTPWAILYRKYPNILCAPLNRCGIRLEMCVIFTWKVHGYAKYTRLWPILFSYFLRSCNPWPSQREIHDCTMWLNWTPNRKSTLARIYICLELLLFKCTSTLKRTNQMGRKENVSIEISPYTIEFHKFENISGYTAINGPLTCNFENFI